MALIKIIDLHGDELNQCVAKVLQHDTAHGVPAYDCDGVFILSLLDQERIAVHPTDWRIASPEARWHAWAYVHPIPDHQRSPYLAGAKYIFPGPSPAIAALRCFLGLRLPIRFDDDGVTIVVEV